jgi:hypothetical protein
LVNGRTIKSRGFLGRYDVDSPSASPSSSQNQTQIQTQTPTQTGPLAAAEEDEDDGKNSEKIIPSSNGFVHTILHAWEQDLHLTLRPDDVWLCILSQFSFFVNGRAEALRHFFVAHEGKKEVILNIQPHRLETVDVGAAAQGLVRLVKGNMVDGEMVDGEMVEWLMPGFSTTSEHDRATAAMVVLGVVKQFFSYSVTEGCGFPSVTLEGEGRDWVELVQRVGRLAMFGEEAG